LTQTNLARFKGKNAVVTGATSGIGNAIVRRLLAEGANVVAAGRRETLLQALEKEYQGSVLGVRTDVMVESDVAQLVQQCVARFGSLQIAFNVAGAATIGTIVDGSSEDWESTIDLCLRSVYWSIKYQAKQFIAQGTGGSIVNVSSLNQVVPFYGASSYATAKAGVGMLTQNAALELARHRIRVNALLPASLRLRRRASFPRPLTSMRCTWSEFRSAVRRGRRKWRLQQYFSRVRMRATSPAQV
jgi:NAD(P)-dependent dehydrogenase (short-subunit alcohol dehydrogenase family)